MSLDTRRSSAARAPTPSKKNSPMCERSKRPAAFRTARCSATMPPYWIGISQPANGTIFAPSATCRSYSGVRSSSVSTVMPRPAARRARVVGMKGPPRIAIQHMGAARRAGGALQEPRFVDHERETAVKELRGAPRQHHPRQEDLEVLHDRRDLGVDREVERDELLF